MNIVSAILARAKEPSSYAAIAAVLTMVGVNIGEEMWSNIVMGVTSLAAVAGIMMGEKGKPDA